MFDRFTFFGCIILIADNDHVYVHTFVLLVLFGQLLGGSAFQRIYPRFNKPNPIFNSRRRAHYTCGSMALLVRRRRRCLNFTFRWT